MPCKEGYGMKKSDKMGMYRVGANGKKMFWDSPTMGNPKPTQMYKESREK